MVMLENRVALVTGAGRGLGRATALAMAREGTDVVVVDIIEENVDNVAREITEMGRKSLACKADVTIKEQVKNVFLRALDMFGKLDILVNNVGLCIIKPAIEVTEEEWDYVMNVDLKSMFLCSQEAAKIMFKQKSGVIVNISSILSLSGFIKRIGYCTAKAGVNALTRTLACEWGPHGIRVNAVAPGWILTEPLKNFFDTGKLKPDNMLNHLPIQRFGTPEDIAEAVLFLVSDKAAWISGQILYVDGGFHAYRGPENIPDMI